MTAGSLPDATLSGTSKYFPERAMWITYSVASNFVASHENMKRVFEIFLPDRSRNIYKSRVVFKNLTGGSKILGSPVS